MGIGLEKDLLRDHEVPFFSYYEIQTFRTILNYTIIGDRGYPRLIRAV